MLPRVGLSITICAGWRSRRWRGVTSRGSPGGNTPGMGNSPSGDARHVSYADDVRDSSPSTRSANMALTSDEGEVHIEGSDAHIRPQDDLFGHVNGRWLETVEIPPDLPMVGGFVSLALEAEAQVDQILRDAAAAASAGQVGQGSPQQ